jgi:hypothetical protein
VHLTCPFIIRGHFLLFPRRERKGLGMWGLTGNVLERSQTNSLVKAGKPGDSLWLSHCPSLRPEGPNRSSLDLRLALGNKYLSLATRSQALGWPRGI